MIFVGDRVFWRASCASCRACCIAEALRESLMSVACLFARRFEKEGANTESCAAVSLYNCVVFMARALKATPQAVAVSLPDVVCDLVILLSARHLA